MTVAFNAQFTPTAFEHLQQLADKLQCSKAHALRTAVSALYRHECARVPTCANGQACYVPQMHPNTQAAATLPRPI